MKQTTTKGVIIVSSTDAPRVAHYSPCRAAGPFLFLAGQVAVDRDLNVVGATVAEQTRQSLTNMRELLEANGASMENVVTVSAFLSNMDEFPEYEEAYREFFPNPPARTTVQARLGPGFLVELNAVAYVGQ